MIRLIDFDSTSTKFEERPLSYEATEYFDIKIRYKKDNEELTKVFMIQKGFQTYGYSIPHKLSFLAPRIAQSNLTWQDKEYNTPILALQAIYDLGEKSGFTEEEARSLFSQMVDASYSPRIRTFIARGFTLVLDCKSLHWGEDTLGNSPLIKIV